MKNKQSQNINIVNDSSAEQQMKMNGIEANKKDIKDLIAPSGIDASSTNHLEIVASTSKYARTMVISALPRMCTFPLLLRDMYNFGDINVSVFIRPISEAKSQSELNRTINELETERIVAADRGNINRESMLAQKRNEAEELRDAIASGFDKLFEASIMCTIFAYDLEELDRQTEMLTADMSKTLTGIKTAWAMQEDAFKSNLPFNEDKIEKKHTFDRRSMGTVFPFINADVGHENGIPIGFNRQTGLPILYDNFSPTLSNYNMVVFGKSGAGKGVTIKTLIARSAVLMGIESLALDAEGEYGVVADALGGINVVISPTSNTIINPFDVEPEITKDEITGREMVSLNVENKIEDVTQVLLTMARGSTQTDFVNEVTKQIIAEAAAEEYASLGITNDINSLYSVNQGGAISNGYLGRRKKAMPTIGSWYHRILLNASQNKNPDYREHYSYLTKVMKQYVREYNGQMSYFDGQSTFDLLEGTTFINLDISGLEERFARPLAQQILLSWIWEKFVKKNSEDKSKAKKKRVLIDEAWMLLPFPEAVDFLNKMARRARKRNVSLAVVSQRFQDFYEKSEVQAVLTSSDTKLFLAQDKSEIQYIKEVFKLSDGEAAFLTTCSRGQGLFKVGEQTAIIEIRPTKKEFEFIETNINKIQERNENG